MHRLVRMPKRRGIWLFDYEQIKHRTPFQWFASSLLGGLALIGGAFVGWLSWQASDRAEWYSRLFALTVPAAMIAYGVVNFPGGIIYLLRRRRGEPVDVWDCETPDDP